MTGFLRAPQEAEQEGLPRGGLPRRDPPVDPDGIGFARFLSAVTDTVVACCDPDAVALFGSWAKGTADVHSDVDLLVLGPFRASPRLRDRDVCDALRRFAIRFDLHLVTPAELAAAPPHSYLDTLRRTCQVLYARDGVDLPSLGLPDHALTGVDRSPTLTLVEGT